jgi:ubiquinone/menaquinone biosynthesis C-methylase UbiE
VTQYDSPHVPGREHYSLAYLRGGRIFSYAHQIESALSFEPRTVLEIGTGSGMVAAALRSVGIEVTTVDIQPELQPDVTASVMALPFADARYDVALCCQVLEHSPFEEFVPALKELRRVTRDGLIVSLPDVMRHNWVDVCLPRFRHRLSWTVPHLRPVEMPRARFEKLGHYWEIGLRGYPLRRVLASITQAGWSVMCTWKVPELPWHRFLRLV